MGEDGGGEEGESLVKEVVRAVLFSHFQERGDADDGEDVFW